MSTEKDITYTPEAGIFRTMVKDVEKFEREERAKRLKDARVAAGFKGPRSIEDAFGWNVNNYKAHESGRNGFGIADARIYAKAFNVDLEWLFLGKGDRNKSANTNVSPNNPEGTPGSRIQQVRVVGSVKASFWQDVTDQVYHDEPMYVPSASGFPAEWQYAYTVDGPSVNKTARDGDILVCVDLIKSGVDIMENDLVIVERTRFDGAMLERTAKRVRRAIAGHELWPDSDDPEFQDPLPLSVAEESEEVRVSAKVVWVLRKP